MNRQGRLRHGLARFSMVVALVVAGSAGGAAAAPLLYEIIDWYELVRPDATPGDPFDKDFSVSGTIEASRLGDFLDPENNPGQPEDPFRSWNITNVVRKAGQPDTTYTFNESNSSWLLGQDGIGVIGLPPLTITENFINLNDTCFQGINEIGTNTLILSNQAANQALIWANPGCADQPWIFQSGTINPQTSDGQYVSEGGGVIRVARRIPAVPLPAGLPLLLTGLFVLAGLRRR